MPVASLFDLVKPVLWLAFAAFVTGFASYLALGGTHVEAKAPAAHAAQVSAASGNWNRPKSI